MAVGPMDITQSEFARITFTIPLLHAWDRESMLSPASDANLIISPTLKHGIFLFCFENKKGTNMKEGLVISCSTPARYWLCIPFSSSTKGSFAVRTLTKWKAICVIEDVKEYPLCDKDRSVVFLQRALNAHVSEYLSFGNHGTGIGI